MTFWGALQILCVFEMALGVQLLIIAAILSVGNLILWIYKGAP